MNYWKLAAFLIGCNGGIVAMQPYEEWGNSAHQAEIYPYSSALGYIGGLFDGELPFLFEKYPDYRLDAVAREIFVRLPLSIVRRDDESSSHAQPSSVDQTSLDDEAMSVDSKESAGEASVSEKALFVCQYCRESFEKKFDLFAHIHKKHEKMLPLKCICGKRYACKAAFALHLCRKHQMHLSGSAVYHCAIDSCHKAYLTRVGLVRHMRKTHGK